MRDLAVRFAWLFIVLVVLAYLVFLFLGSFITAHAIDESRIVTIRDSLQPGVHQLSGMVMVPRTCAELAVQTTALSSSTYALQFTTWNEPSVACITDDTPRAFTTTVFAPAAGVRFVGSLDDAPLSVVVYPYVPTP